LDRVSGNYTKVKMYPSLLDILLWLLRITWFDLIELIFGWSVEDFLMLMCLWSMVMPIEADRPTSRAIGKVSIFVGGGGD
jgi:hypothetical protein